MIKKWQTRKGSQYAYWFAWKKSLKVGSNNSKERGREDGGKSNMRTNRNFLFVNLHKCTSKRFSWGVGKYRKQRHLKANIVKPSSSWVFAITGQPEAVRPCTYSHNAFQCSTETSFHISSSIDDSKLKSICTFALWVGL